LAHPLQVSKDRDAVGSKQPSRQWRDTKMLLEQPDVCDLFSIHSLFDDRLCMWQHCIDRNVHHAVERAGEAPWSMAA